MYPGYILEIRLDWICGHSVLDKFLNLNLSLVLFLPPMLWAAGLPSVL